MRTARARWAAIAAAVGLGAAAPASPLAQADADLRAAETAVKAHTDGFFLDDAPGSPAQLETQWAAARRWAAAWLQGNPDAAPASLANAAKHEGLEVSSVRLDADSVLVSASVDQLGTAFILRRAADGRFVTALALDEPGTWGGAGPAELAAWRSDRAGDGCRQRRTRSDWGRCGPMAGDVVRLSDEADGARRFAVVGRYSQMAGATIGFQVSVWRWNGRAAEPLLAVPLAQMADDPVVVSAGPTRLVLHAKDEFKRMFACGSCSGRQVEIPIELAAARAQVGRKRSLVPELDLVDSLFDRLFRGEPAGDLAASDVAARLGPLVRDAQEDARKNKLEPTFGMIDGWKVARHDGVETLCLNLDNFDAPKLFTIETQGGRRRVTSVREEKACDGAGAQS